MNFPWQPRLIRRVVAAKETGTEVVEIVTDHGPAFAKFLGNREGPHVLAAEYLGTRLAAAMGLPVLDWSTLEYDGFPEIRLPSGGLAKAGSAWCTRRVEGFVWSGIAADLKEIENPADLAKLVLFDQWTLNCDRYRPLPPPNFRKNLQNVFFSRESETRGKMRLMAMDHTHILTCGSPFRGDLARIGRVRDETAYGRFPEFMEWIRREHAVAAVEAMNSVEADEIRAIVREIPADWEVEEDHRRALIDFLLDRRNWLSAEFVTRLFPQGELF
jgi:hypothetical protein